MSDDVLLVPQKKVRPVGFPEKMDPADFVGYMCQHFRVYHKEGSAEEIQWQDAIEAILSVYEHEVLADTCLWFLQHRKEVRFPLPAEIIKVADAVAKERIRPKLLAKEAQDIRANPYSEDRNRMIIAMMRSPMGHQAIREGWAGQLADHIRQNLRMPEPSLVPTLKRRAQGTYELRERCYREEWAKKGGLFRACAETLELVDARNRQIAEAVEGASA